MTTHWTVGRSELKLLAMDGNATFTLPWSITLEKLPMAMAPKPQYL